MTSPKYINLILDLGGVLMPYSAESAIALHPRQLKNALDSPYWHEYERGNITEDDCHGKICQDFRLDPEKWKLALGQMRESMQANVELISALKELRASYPHLHVFGLSNIPKSDYAALQPILDSWMVFDDFYPSSAIGCRKPDFASYKAMVELAKLDTSQCIFVDDTIENVIAGQSLGLQCILFTDTTALITKLYNTIGDPVERGMAYLRKHGKNLVCETSDGTKHHDNFSQLLILECIGDESIVKLEKKGPTWNYFIGEPEFAGTVYSNDSDTTSLAMVVIQDVSNEEKETAMETILSYLNPDGLPYCWFDSNRPRFCHCICANVFRFFHLNNWRSKLPGVYDYLCNILRTKAYLLDLVTTKTQIFSSTLWQIFAADDRQTRLWRE